MEIIPDSIRSEEHLYDPRFVRRWADRCIEIYKKYNQQAANDYAREFLGPELIQEVNKEIEARKKKK